MPGSLRIPNQSPAGSLIGKGGILTLTSVRGLLVALLLLIASGSLSGGLQAAEIRSYAIVRDDATLVVRSQVIRLHGIFIPQTNRVCGFDQRPVQCGERAARALRSRIQGFVTCAPVQRLRDRSLSAYCFADPGSATRDPIDLGAHLISQGLAVAGRNAPFEYRTLERIAERRGIGIWGTFVDQIR